MKPTITSKNLIVLSCIGFSLLLLAGCAGYKARPLKRLLNLSNSESKESSLVFDFYVFTKNDCKNYLDRDVISKGYQPIQIALANNSNRRLRLSMDSFSMPIIDAEEVAQKVHTSTVKRAASYGVGALFIPILIIPAVVDGVGSSQANQKLDLDFDQKAMHDRIIEPYTTINGIIFTSVEGFKQEFSFSVFDAETNERFVLSTSKPKLTV